MITRVCTQLALVAALGLSGTAQAINIPNGYVGLTYNATLAEDIDSVYQISFVNLTSNGTGYGFPYFLPSGTSSVTQIWPTFAPYSPVEASIALGLVTNIPGDPINDTTTHVAVFGNFAPNQISMDFSTLFPDVDESTLIDGLMNNNLDSSVYGSIAYDAQMGGLFVSPGGNFSIVAFTQGQVIGTGTFIIETPLPVPEPANYLLMGLGLLVVLSARRRKQNLAD